MLLLRRWDVPQAAFVFDLLDRTGWLMVVPSGELLPVLTAREMDSAPQLVGELKHVVHVVKSEVDVLSAVEHAFAQWAGYRDQIVKG